MKYLLVAVLLLSMGAALSPEPIPTCSTPKIELRDLPVSVNEIQSYDVNNLFTGFNLDFELSSSAPDFVRLKEKTVKVKSHDIEQVGLKSYHLDHMGNRWGRNLMTLSENNWVTKIRWGSANANETIPDLTEEVTVESEQNIYCYDAIWLREEHIAIVDCAKKVTFGLKNIFIYVNTTSQTVLPRTFENDMYVGFTTISRRRMVLHRENEFTYLIRAYFANHVDIHHAGNTYLDVMTIVDPFKPRTLKVIDRSFLHQPELSITDFKLYKGALYLLDYNSGVTVFDFTAAQQVRIFGRYRTDSGYLRMGVYSGHLDNQIIFALANEHAIYEVDFSNHLKPKTIAKYSLMQQSRIHSVWVNEQYVIAQFSANVTTSVEGRIDWYNSTIVFNRDSRTYLHAYDILEHTAENVIVDLERDRNLVLVIDPAYMNLYQLNRPVMSVYPTDKSLLGKEYSFYIKGNSINTYTNHSLFCSFNFKFRVVDVEDIKVYPTGLQLPEAYYANFPGELFIPLARYALGPNITYGVHQSVPSGKSSAWWILQQNQTLLHWDKQPSMAKITFLRQEQYDTVRDTTLFIYTQDAANITHFLECETVPYTKDVKCKDDGYLPHVKDKINNLTATRFDQYAGRHVHLAAIVYETYPNQIFIYNADTKEQMTQTIVLPESYEGRITGLQFLGGHYLAAVLRYTKQIVFFDIRACIDHQEKKCEMLGKIDSIEMDRLGVNYFAPMDIYTSDFHPGVLFIQNLDRVIIVSFNIEGAHLLAQIESPGSKEPGYHKWKMAISRNHLVIVNPPNIIEEHSLEEIYTTRQAPMHKLYPVYQNTYTIPDSFDLDFSDQGDLFYITAEDLRMHQGHNSVILVYRAGFPACASLYDVFNVGMKFSDMLIDATGAFGDYVSVTLGSIFQMFRQYEIPILVFDDNFYDFDFNITYSNDMHEQDKFYMNSSVKISNSAQKIVVNNSKLNNTEFLNSQVKYEDEKKEYILDDSDWFKGNVINYTLEGCSECGQKLKVVNHLEHKRFVLAERDMEDYVFNDQGGLVQQFQSMLSMRHNGSIAQSIAFPSVLDGQNCRTITYSWLYEVSVSACEHLGEVYLYLTSLTSFKPFVNGPHVSSASSVASIHMQQDIFILVDVDQNPSQMSREGGVIIYSINHDISSPDIFNELEFIDTTDLVVAQGWTHGDTVYIGNAHLVFTNESSTYRLAITELNNGVFFVDFKWVKGMTSVEILRIQFMDLREELLKAHLTMPNMAFFQAVTVVNQFYNSGFKYWESDLIVTTRNFHIFEVKCHFDQTGSLLTHEITHVYYRYGFYETSNYIKTFDGYFAVTQKIPLLYEDIPWFSKQVITVYDSRERWVFSQDSPSTPKQTKQGDIPASYMLGGMIVPKGHVAFDFNFTLTRNRTDPFRDIGMLMLHARQATLREVAIHDHISIVTQKGIPDTQNAKFVAFNDYSTFEIPLDIVVHSGSDGWVVTLIVLGCLIVAGVAGFLAYKWYLNKKRGGEEGSGIKKSLLQEEGDQEDDDDDDEDDDDDDDDDEEDDDEGDKVEQKPIETKPTEPVASQPAPEAINRETVTSVEYGGDERIEEGADEEKVEEKVDQKEGQN